MGIWSILVSGPVHVGRLIFAKHNLRLVCVIVLLACCVYKTQLVRKSALLPSLCSKDESSSVAGNGTVSKHGVGYDSEADMGVEGGDIKSYLYYRRYSEEQLLAEGDIDDLLAYVTERISEIDLTDIYNTSSSLLTHAYTRIGEDVYQILRNIHPNVFRLPDKQIFQLFSNFTQNLRHSFSSIAAKTRIHFEHYPRAKLNRKAINLATTLMVAGKDFYQISLLFLDCLGRILCILFESLFLIIYFILVPYVLTPLFNFAQIIWISASWKTRIVTIFSGLGAAYLYVHFREWQRWVRKNNPFNLATLIMLFYIILRVLDFYCVHHAEIGQFVSNKCDYLRDNNYFARMYKSISARIPRFLGQIPRENYQQLHVLLTYGWAGLRAGFSLFSDMNFAVISCAFFLFRNSSMWSTLFRDSLRFFYSSKALGSLLRGAFSESKRATGGVNISSNGSSVEITSPHGIGSESSFRAEGRSGETYFNEKQIVRRQNNGLTLRGRNINRYIHEEGSVRESEANQGNHSVAVENKKTTGILQYLKKSLTNNIISHIYPKNINISKQKSYSSQAEIFPNLIRKSRIDHATPGEFKLSQKYLPEFVVQYFRQTKQKMQHEFVGKKEKCNKNNKIIDHNLDLIPDIDHQGSRMMENKHDSAENGVFVYNFLNLSRLYEDYGYTYDLSVFLRFLNFFLSIMIFSRAMFIYNELVFGYFSYFTAVYLFFYRLLNYFSYMGDLVGLFRLCAQDQFTLFVSLAILKLWAAPFFGGRISGLIAKRKYEKLRAAQDSAPNSTCTSALSSAQSSPRGILRNKEQVDRIDKISEKKKATISPNVLCYDDPNIPLTCFPSISHSMFNIGLIPYTSNRLSNVDFAFGVIMSWLSYPLGYILRISPWSDHCSPSHAIGIRKFSPAPDTRRLINICDLDLFQESGILSPSDGLLRKMSSFFTLPSEKFSASERKQRQYYFEYFRGLSGAEKRGIFSRVLYSARNKIASLFNIFTGGIFLYCGSALDRLLLMQRGNIFRGETGEQNGKSPKKINSLENPENNSEVNSGNNLDNFSNLPEAPDNSGNSGQNMSEKYEGLKILNKLMYYFLYVLVILKALVRTWSWRILIAISIWPVPTRIINFFLFYLVYVHPVLGALQFLSTLAPHYYYYIYPLLLNLRYHLFHYLHAASLVSLRPRPISTKTKSAWSFSGVLKRFQSAPVLGPVVDSEEIAEKDGEKFYFETKDANKFDEISQNSVEKMDTNCEENQSSSLFSDVDFQPSEEITDELIYKHEYDEEHIVGNKTRLIICLEQKYTEGVYWCAYFIIISYFVGGIYSWLHYKPTEFAEILTLIFSPLSTMLSPVLNLSRQILYYLPFFTHAKFLLLIAFQSTLNRASLHTARTLFKLAHTNYLAAFFAGLRPHHFPPNSAPNSHNIPHFHPSATNRVEINRAEKKPAQIGGEVGGGVQDWESVIDSGEEELSDYVHCELESEGEIGGNFGENEKLSEFRICQRTPFTCDDEGLTSQNHEEAEKENKCSKNQSNIQTDLSHLETSSSQKKLLIKQKLLERKKNCPPPLIGPGTEKGRFMETQKAEKIDQEIQGKIGKKFEENIEVRIGEKIDRNIGEKIEDKIDRNIGEKIEHKIDRNIGEKIEDEIDRNIGEKIERRIGGKIRIAKIQMEENELRQKQIATSATPKKSIIERKNQDKNKENKQQNLEQRIPTIENNTKKYTKTINLTKKKQIDDPLDQIASGNDLGL